MIAHSGFPHFRHRLEKWIRGKFPLASMSELTYKGGVTTGSKALRWLHGEVKTPPMSLAARREIGYLLRALQEGEVLTMP
jgi:hypothetical protein